MRKLLAGFTAVMLGIGALAACSSSGGSDGKNSAFRILLVIGKTGPYASISSDSIRGFQAAVASVNAAGGVAGKKVTLDIRDDQGDPTKAVSVLQKALTSSDKPDAVIPSVVSPEALAMAPLLTRSKIFAAGFASGTGLNDPSKYPYYFQISSNNTAQMVGLAGHLKSAGVTKLGLISSQDDFGTGLIAAAKTALAGSGISLVTQLFAPTDIDLTVSYRRLLASHPGAVLMDATGDPAPRLLKARVSAGGTSTPTIIGAGMVATGTGPYSYGSAEANKNADYLAFGVTEYKPPAQRTAVFNEFYKRYGAAGAIKSSITAPALAWDTVRFIAATADQAKGTNDAAKLTAAAESLKVPPHHWLTVQKLSYTPDKHTPTVTAADFPFIPAGPLVDGLFKPSS